MSALMIPLDVRQPEANGELNLKAICIWAAFGFMLDNDTFYKDIYWERPQTIPWYYEPVTGSFDQAVERFAATFEQVVAEQIAGREVILPLSGGLDSRTLAAALHRLKIKPFTYSYKFLNSFNETKYGEQIAKLCGWDFKDYVIPQGYLWDSIEELSSINQCYSEFTHPRQMAVTKDITSGNLFLLGHWGDVLFDNMRLSDTISDEELADIVIKKMLKKGGMELAADLWNAWGLDGDFKDHLKSRVVALLGEIKITNANARARAFKSMHWATRWTNSNLQVFSHYHPIAVPYYDERICRSVCETDEQYLAGRKIQIEYLKRYAPQIARVPWQSKEPYNLFDHHKHLTWRHLPWRIADKARRGLREKVGGAKLVTRNWEIQFVGAENDRNLGNWLQSDALSSVVPNELTKKYYSAFKEKNAVHYSHPVSMLLTLSSFLSKRGLVNNKALPEMDLSSQKIAE